MSSGSLRLVTANLFSHRVDSDDLGAVIDRLEPDLLAAVELSSSAADVIASRFPHSHLVPEAGYSGWGIASRVPMSVDPGRAAWRRGGSARFELDGREIRLAIVHIIDPLHLPVRRTAAIRRGQVEALLEWGRQLPQGSAQLVVGDFNASPLWPAYRRLASRWRDLIAASGTTKRTWGIPGGPMFLRIDHVLGEGLEAFAVDAVPIRGSDHLAVVADLRLV